uniref:Predicted protein n=1 Tax=Physcomitrium patens TaxID=3218 RepID=A9U5F5_PHYPA
MEKENKNFEGSLRGDSGRGSSKGQEAVSEWIERPNKNLQVTKLLREFERQYSQLSKVEKLTLEPNKINLFLQATDGELQEKLELFLEDKEEDEGLTTKWKNIENVVGLLTKRERRKDRNNIPKTIQAPKAPVRTTPPTMPIVQPSTSLSKKVDMAMEEIIRGMRDLQIKLAKLQENTSTNNLKNVSKQGYKDGKIALKDMEDLLQTNFDYLKEHETAARIGASYGTRVDDDLGRSMETSEFWASAISTMQEAKLPREVLLRTTTTIRGTTGWEDLVGSLSVHAYIAKSQHEALMEEKRRGNFDDTREENSSKRQTRGDKAREAASQELHVKDTSTSLEEKTRETKDKDKSIAYKLLSDIEAATNFKEVLEERILNAKVKFTLKEVLGIAKKEMSHAIDARIYKDEEEVDIGYKQPTNEKNGYNQRVRFEDYSDKEMKNLSHYTRKHWARATIEKQKYPIDMEHGWTIRVANNTRGELYGACPDVRIRIGDVATEQHFFVQDTTSYPLILGQPYIAATRIETKVLDDGSAYARRDYGGTKEEVFSQDEGTFDVSFIGILENGNIMYKKVDDFKRKERKRLYNIEGELCKLGTLQDDERILGVYEENGLEDSLELITSIELEDNDKIVEIHSKEVYTILESFQAPEVTVETRYKTADKKVKPTAGPLPEDSKEQMGEASKEASLRDPMRIGHQFTKETFEELKIGCDGSLLSEEITCFKKMLAKQGRSFAFKSYEIGRVDLNIITPMVIFTVPHQEDESDLDNEGNEDELDKDVENIF